MKPSPLSVARVFLREHNGLKDIKELSNCVLLHEYRMLANWEAWFEMAGEKISNALRDPYGPSAAWRLKPLYGVKVWLLVAVF